MRPVPSRGTYWWRRSKVWKHFNCVLYVWYYRLSLRYLYNVLYSKRIFQMQSANYFYVSRTFVRSTISVLLHWFCSLLMSSDVYLPPLKIHWGTHNHVCIQSNRFECVLVLICVRVICWRHFCLMVVIVHHWTTFLRVLIPPFI